MSERVNPFAVPEAAPQFTVKPKAPKPAQHVEDLAREHNFPSRPAAVPRPVVAESTTSDVPRGTKTGLGRRRRTYKTGRNQQLNFKATAATVERFYAMADKKGVALCELLERALDALEREAG
jgi:hypothetical protein